MALMRMTRWNWDRIAAASGIAFVALAVAAALAGGLPPDATASAPQVADYYRDYRSGLLIGSYLSGFAYVTFLWFAAALARRIGLRASSASPRSRSAARSRRLRPCWSLTRSTTRSRGGAQRTGAPRP
jgi:hypothetical protein